MISVEFQDILHANVDAIVNPANTHLRHMGGLARIIANAAGPELERESQRKRPIATGSAVLTTAGKLPFRGVIHVAGPIWQGGDYHERELLAKAHDAAIILAGYHGFDSIAFPAVSCGIFHFPVEEAAPIAIAATREALLGYPNNIDVIFCLLDENHYEAFSNALDG